MAVSNDFTSSELDLNGQVNITSPTALVWGPDGRLYVTEVDGDVKVLTVAFGDPDESDDDPTAQFYVTDAETIGLVKDIQNYNDDGTTNGGSNRQVTGVDVTQQYDASGQPVFAADGTPLVTLYVTSSDSRIGAGGDGNDANLDTNSGTITRLTQQPDGSWDAVDIVRGLARSEENHATNGLEVIQELDENGNLMSERLIVANGGNANTGAPSNNFAGQQEQPLSAAILEVDLDQINALPVQTDGSGRQYVYDVPTLDDPTRDGATDLNDPFGGNDGLNSGILTADGPVQIYSAGYRNAYDVEVTEDGRVWTYDNGANNNWGGRPAGEDNDGDANATEAAELNGTPEGYIATNLFVEDNGEIGGNFDPQNWDQLHEVTRSDDLNGRSLSAGQGGAQTYQWDHPDFDQPLTLVYGGHPNPTRAEGARAGVLYSPQDGVAGAKLMVSNVDNGSGSDFLEVVAWFKSIGYSDQFIADTVVALDPGVRYADQFVENYTLPTQPGVFSLVEDANGPIGLPANIDEIVHALNPIEGDYREAGYTDGALDTGKGSINGLTEYTSSIFEDAGQTGMQGALFAASLNQGQYYIIGRDGDGIVQTTTDGGRTIADDRTFFQSGGAPLGLASIGDDLEAFDNNGAFRGSVWGAIYKQNGPVIEVLQPGNPGDNALLGVNFYAGQEPFDPTDNDLDGVDHINDPFEFDADNGLALAVGQTIELNFSQVDLAANPEFSGTIGDTGLMGAALDGVTPNRDAITEADGAPAGEQQDGLFDNAGNIIPGGNAPILQIKDVQDGTAIGSANDLRDGLHTGIKLDDGVQRLTAEVDIANWWTDQPGGGRISGVTFGDGTQSNFVRLVWGDVDGDGTPGLRVVIEVGDQEVYAQSFTDAAFAAAVAGDASQVTLQLEISDIGGGYDIAAGYRIDDAVEFTDLGVSQQVPAGVLRDVLDGTHTISDGDTTLPSGAAIGIVAEKDDGVSFTSVDFPEIRIEGFGNEIAASDATAASTATGTDDVDTIVYEGDDTGTVTLQPAVENLDASATTGDFAVNANDLSNTITVGSGVNTITTGAGADVVKGSTARLNGDTVTDFSKTDTLVVTDLTTADVSDLSFQAGSIIVSADGFQVTLDGPETDGFDASNPGASLNFVDGEEGLEISLQPDETVLYRVNAGGGVNSSGAGTIAAVDDGPDWLSDADLTGSGVFLSGTTANTYSSGQTSAEDDIDYDNVDPDTVPWQVFVNERSDNNTSDAPLGYNFSVEAGTTYRIEIFYTENWQGIFESVDREFDVAVEGVVPSAFDDINPLAEAEAFVGSPAPTTNTGPQATEDQYLGVARKAEFVYTAQDDLLTLEWLHGTQNPKVNAIQITQLGGAPLGDTVPPVVQSITVADDLTDQDSPRLATLIVTDDTGLDLADLQALDGDALDFTGITPDSVTVDSVSLSSDGKTGTIVYELAPPAGAWPTGTFSVGVAAGVFEDSAGNEAGAASFDFTFAEPPQPGDVVLAVNAGGPAVDGAAYGLPGVTFEADTTAAPHPTVAFADGGNGNNGNNNGADDTFTGADLPDTVFTSERWGNDFAYNVDLADGTYLVDLYFAETYQGVTGGDADGGVGSRLFDVEIEGQTVLDDYDLYDDGDGTLGDGQGAPLVKIVKTFEASVEDGVLTIAFDALGTDASDNAKISAFVVRVPDDAVTAALSGPGSVAEADGAASYNVTLSADPSEATTVTVDVAAGSVDPASVPGDAELSAGGTQLILTFQPGGPLTQSFDVAILDDTLPELAESFEVSLSGIGITAGNDGAITTQILANDGPVDSVGGVDVTGGDFSDDNLAPTDIGTLGEGATTIVATQQGDNAAGGRERDYFTFTVAEGRELTGIVIKGYEGGETDGPSQGFMAIAEGNQVPLSQAEFEANFPDGTGLLGGYVYNSSDIDANVLDDLGDGEEQSYSFVGFDAPLGAGTYTLWLNQGASNPSTVTLDLVSAAVADVITLSIADADPVEEAEGATLDFALSASDATFSGTVEVTYDTADATGLTQDVVFTAGAGTLSIQVTNDDIDDADDVISVTLTGAASADTSASIVIGTDASATGTVTEDDVSEPALIRGDVVAAFNAGGPALTFDGVDFAAATSGTDGAPFSGGAPFADSTDGNGLQPVYDGTIYATEINDGGDDVFAFSSATNIEAGKSYFVDLYFAEIYTDAVGGRVFDVLLEGELVLDDLDIVATTGDADIPLKIELAQPVAPGANGAIDLSFVALEDRGKISGIVIREAVDPDAVAVSVADVTVDEDAGLAAVTFTRTGADDEAVTVAYQTGDGTAEAGADYTATSGSIEIPAGGTGSVTVEIPLLDDALEEGDETFTVTITSATAATNNVTVADTEATVTLTDDETVDPADIDGDGVLNVDDPFAYDGSNGGDKVLAAGVTFRQDFDVDTSNVFDAGFSGIIVNPEATDIVSTAGDPYGDRTTEATSLVENGVLKVTSSQTDVFGTDSNPNAANNNIKDNYQSAADVSGVDSFSVEGKIQGGWLGTNPGAFASFGITLGAGGTDEYIKFVLGGTADGVRLQLAQEDSLTGAKEQNGTLSAPDIDIDQTQVASAIFRIDVDKVASTLIATATLLDAGGAELGVVTMGPRDIDPAGSFAAALDGNNPLTGGTGGVAYGISVTDWGSAAPFEGQWDYLEISGPEPVNAAPSAVTLETVIDPLTIAEDANAAGAVKIADIVVTDDGLGENTLDLIGDDAELFEIVGTELFLKADATLDADANATLDVAVTVDDADVGTTPDATSAPLSIAVSDVNTAPVVTLTPALDPAEISEAADVTERTKVADITVTDDATGVNTLSLSGDDAELFEIDGAELFLKADAALDFETNAQLDVTVSVDDATIGTEPEDSADLSLGVTDANDAPTITGTIDPLAVATGEAGSVDLSTLILADEDTGDTPGLVVRLADGGELPAGITLDGTTLNVAGTVAEGSYEIAVFADDGMAESALSVAFTVTVSDATLLSLGAVSAQETDDNGVTTLAVPVTSSAGTAAEVAVTYSVDGGDPLSATVVLDATGAGTLSIEVGNDDLADGDTSIEVALIATTTDGFAVDATAVTASVTEDDFAPVANADSESVFAGQSLTFDPAADDTDGDDATADLTVIAIDNVSGGIATLNPDGTVTIDATGAAAGDIVTFDYIVSDPAGNTGAGSASVSVTAAPSGDPIRIQAEDFDSASVFTVERVLAADGRQVISLPNDNPGTATFDLAARGIAPGVYTVAIGHFDENDGESTVGIDIVSSDANAAGLSESFLLEEPTSSNKATAASFRVKTFTDVEIGADGQLTLSGTRDSVPTVELVRLDYIEFTRTGDLDGGTGENQPPAVPQDPGIQEVEVNAAYTLDLNTVFVDPESDGFTVALIAGTLPDGLSFENGVLSGTPTGAVDNVVLTFVATDTEGSVSTPLDITFTSADVNEAPVSVDIIDATLTAGTAFNLDAGAAFSDPDAGDTLSFALAGDLPEGLTFDPLTGIVSGTPTEVGAFEVTVTATDTGNLSASETFTLTVQGVSSDPIRIQAEDFDSASVFQIQNQSAADGQVIFLPNDDPGTATFDLAARGIAPGVYTVAIGHFDENDGESTLGIDITSSDANADGLSQTFLLDDDATSGSAAQAASFRVKTFANVEIGADGVMVLSGTRDSQPTIEFARIDYVEFTRTGDLDGGGTGDNEAPFVPAILEPGLQEIDENAAYTLDLNTVFVDAEEDAFTVALTAGALPEGMTLVDGVLSGAPTEPVDGLVATFVATDVGGNVSAPLDITFNVADVNEAPESAGIDDATLTEGTAFNLDAGAAFSDPDAGDTLSFALAGDLPGGLTFDPLTGIVSGTPSETGSFQVTVTATDSGDLSTSETFVLNVQGGDRDPIRIEAEDFTLVDGFFVESGSRIRLAPEDTGEATFALDGSGASGSYDVRIGFFDESDGTSTATVSAVNGTGADAVETVIGTWAFDKNDGGNAVQAQNFRVLTFTGLDVQPGTVLKLTGDADGGEYVRIDYVELVPSAGGNFAPTVSNAIPDQDIDSLSVSIDLSNVFSDPEEDALSYSVTSVPAADLAVVNGQLVGTLPAGGDYTITVSATDGPANSGITVSDTFVLSAVDDNAAPTLVSAPAGTIVVQEDGSLEEQVLFEDADGIAGYALGPDAPDWIQIDENGFLTGTPLNADVGENIEVQVTATDTRGATSAPVTLTFTVENTNDAPVLGDTLPTDQTGAVGTEFSYVLPADLFTDEDPGEELTIEASGLPAGVTFDAATGTFSGAPTESGSFTVTLSADDGEADPVATEFTIIVDDAVDTRDPVVIEAEDFDDIQAPYEVNSLSFASGDAIIRLPGGATGVAETSLAGIAGGFYTIEIAYIDETDGESTATVSIGDTVIGSWTWDGVAGTQDDPGATTGNFAQPGNFRTISFDTPFAVGADSVLRLEVAAEGGEFGRVDKVTLIPSAAPNGPPSVALENAIAVLADDTDTTGPVKIADITVTDDGVGTNVLGLDGADSDLFEIADGQLFLKAGTDLGAVEGPLDVTVTVDDALIGADIEDSVALSLAVTAGNAAPVLNGPTAVTVDENQTAVAAFTATDADTDDTLSFSVGGLDGDLFSIDANGVLTFDAAPDFEAPADAGADNVYDVTVTVTDGVTPVSSDLAVTVADVEPEGEVEEVVLRLNAFGPEVVVDGAPNWLADDGFFTSIQDRGDAASGTNSSFSATNAPDGVPTEVFETARSSNGDVFYTIPTTELGGNGDYTVNIYVAELFDGNKFAGDRIFDVAIEGALVADNFDPNASGGGQVTVLSYDVSITDGALNIDFIKDLVDGSDNVIVNAIEILTNPDGSLDEDGPAAAITLTNPTEADGTLGVAIALSDASGIDAGSLGADDIVVTVGGVAVPAANVSFDGFANGTASYTVTAPGAWTDGAAVNVTLQAGAVLDTADTPNGNLAVSQSATLDIGGGTTGGDAVIYRINAGGAEVASSDDGPLWAGDLPGAGNEYLNLTGTRDEADTGTSPNPDFEGVPNSVFATARSSDDPFSYDIELGDFADAGENFEVRLYFAELFTAGNPPAQDGGFRNFDATLEGFTPAAFDNIDPGALFGSGAGVLSARVNVDDGVLNIGFEQDIAQNPIINAIEIVAIDEEVTNPTDTDPSGALEAFAAQDDLVTSASYGADVVGSAVLEVMTGNNNVQSSNFGADSFEVTNTGGKKISAIYIDVNAALYPDSVFDPDGQGGDNAAKPWQINTNGGTGAYITGSGYFDAGVDPLPNNTGTGGSSNGGFKGAMVKFTDFDGNETVGFSGDMDPNSIAGLTKSSVDGTAIDSWDVGGISGHELIGSTFTVLFDDGTTASGELASDGSTSGSQALATQDGSVTASAPGLQVDGINPGNTGTYGGDTRPVVIATGDPGDKVQITLTKGFNPVTETSNGIADLVEARLERYDFQVNNVFDAQTVIVTIGSDGTFDASDLFDYDDAVNNNVGDGSFPGDDVQPIGFVATKVQSGGQELPISPTTAPIYLTNEGGPVTGDPTGGGNTGEDGYYQVVGSGNDAYFKVQVEDPNANGGTNPGGKWTYVEGSAPNQNGTQGTGHYYWGEEVAAEALNGPQSNSFLNYTIFIPEGLGGSWAFRARSSRDTNSPSDQRNDIWLRIDDDAEALQVTDTNSVSNGGFVKVFGASTGWGFAQQIDSVSEDEPNFQAVFDLESGFHTITLAGRSEGFHIDFWDLAKVGGTNPGAGAADSAFIPSGPTEPTLVDPIDDVSLVLGSGTTIAAATAFQDLDGDDLDFVLTTNDAGGEVTIDGETGVISVGNGLALGSYTIGVEAEDDDGNTVSDSFEVTVTEEPVGPTLNFSLLEGSGPGGAQIDGQIQNGDTYDQADLAGGVRFSGTFPSGNGVESVELTLLQNGNVVASKVENLSPWDLPVADSLGAGDYTLVADSYSGTGASGTVLNSQSIDFTVTGESGGGNGTSPSELVIPVDASEDDWEESGGAGSPTFELGDNGGLQYVGLRFDGIDIPDGAIIEEAFFRFEALEDGTSDANFSIQIEDTENAAPYTAASDPADRIYTEDTFDWSSVENWNAGSEYESPNIAALLQSVIGTDGVDDGALGFQITASSGSRVAHAFDSDGDAPELVIVLSDDSLI